MSFQKPFMGVELEPGEAWTVSGLLLPAPPPPSSQTPILGLTQAVPLWHWVFSLIPQNISLKQQHHWGRADPNFTSRYVITQTVAAAPGCLWGSLSRSQKSKTKFEMPLSWRMVRQEWLK